MARLILILAAVLLLLASPPVRANQLKPEEFDERMADLVELAAGGNLTIADVVATKEPLAVDQDVFLRNIIKARIAASSGDGPSAYATEGSHNALVKARSGDYYAAECCYRAVMAARAGDYYRGRLFLEESLRSNHREGNGYCLVLYRRWKGETLSYRFLRWWAVNVFSTDPFFSVVTLMVAAQFLALPLLLKLRHAIKSGRRGRALIGPALAVLFAEGVPLFWAVATGSAWAFAYPSAFAYGIHGNESGVALSGPRAGFCVDLVGLFVLMIGSLPPKGQRPWRRSDEYKPDLAYNVRFIAPLLGLIPAIVFNALVMDRVSLVSGAGIAVGSIFYSGAMLELDYFMLLLNRKILIAHGKKMKAKHDAAQSKPV